MARRRRAPRRPRPGRRRTGPHPGEPVPVAARGAPKENRGAVTGRDGDFQLLIDIKSDAGPTCAALDQVVREHPLLMSTASGTQTDRRAVEAVVSGNRDKAAMLAQPTRYAGYDGRLSDLDSGAPASVMPLVSDNWTQQFTWDGSGDMPAAQEQKLRDLVTRAHQHGYRLRFWATPDQPGPARARIWSKEVEAGGPTSSTPMTSTGCSAS